MTMTRQERDLFLKSFPLPKGWKYANSQNKGCLLSAPEFKSFFIDIPKRAPRSLLAKAIGWKGQPLLILDITAGWAKDSLLMASLGCKVTAIESHPFVFYMVQASLEALQPAGPPSQNQPKSLSQGLPLKLLLGDSLDYLKSLKDPSAYPDVIFMDPMFGGRKKSLSKKSLRILKELAGETLNKNLLFKEALKKAKKRVVVKRHKLELPLSENILNSLKGHSVCYDVFQPQGAFNEKNL